MELCLVWACTRNRAALPPLSPLQLMERALAVGLAGVEMPGIIDTRPGCSGGGVLCSRAWTVYHARHQRLSTRGTRSGHRPGCVARSAHGAHCCRWGENRRRPAAPGQSLANVFAGGTDVVATSYYHSGAEEPLDFARRVAPYVKDVHLKDYMIFLSEEGYWLVRCPPGQGVINFPALFTIFSEVCPDAPLSIELGALEARHIRVLADDYWPEYPTRSAAHFAYVWHFVQANA
jgi:hypothetical protein